MKRTHEQTYAAGVLDGLIAAGLLWLMVYLADIAFEYIVRRYRRGESLAIRRDITDHICENERLRLNMDAAQVRLHRELRQRELKDVDGWARTVDAWTGGGNANAGE